MAQTTVDAVLEAMEGLPDEEQGDPLEVVRRRLAERGRRRVRQGIAEARSEFAEGKAQTASVDKIMREIGS